MQPFRDDDEVLRARVTELEEELTLLRDRIAEARAPADGRLDRLERTIESERRLLCAARSRLARPGAASFASGFGVLGFPYTLFMFVMFFVLLRFC